MTWVGLSEQDTRRIADWYEVALSTAIRLARQRETTDERFKELFVKMRADLISGIADDLREIGCPEEKVAKEIAGVERFVARNQNLDSLPTKGSA